MLYDDAMREAERRYWLDMIARCEHNVARVARQSGKNRTWIYGRLKVLSIKIERPWGNEGNEAWQCLSG